jgi:hydroxypyruvate isomerase
MPRFAANLTMMYGEHAFLDRFEAAAQDGFRAVEFLFPYEFEAREIHSRLEVHGLTQVLFNAPPGDWEKGERGLASLPGRQEEFRASIRRALEYAAVLGNERLHVMAGLVEPGLFRGAHHEVYIENLAWAAAQAARQGITILIEPINPRDMPGYFLHRQDEAQAICTEIGAPNLRVQFDFYHAQIVEGDLSVKFREQIAHIGHIQVAGVPDRHEPDEGEVNYPYLFRLIDELNYNGWIGCEYRPRAGTSSGLGCANGYETMAQT